MATLSYRRPRDPEIKQATRLIRDSVNALRRKCNLDTMKQRVTRAHPFILHLKKTDPDGCFGAFEGDRMVGYAQATIREHQWYLAFLFVAPGRWGRGIGQKLLTRALKMADGSDIDLYSLCTYSYNPGAVALYSSFGMTPIEPILHFEWKREGDRALRVPRLKSPLNEEIIDDYEKLDLINSLDLRNRHVARPEDHKYFIDNEGHRIILYRDGRRIAGYAAFFKEGMIAPITAKSPQYLHKITEQAIQRQLDSGCKMVKVFCAGQNRKSIDQIMKMGFRIPSIDLLLSNKPFGNLKLYLPAHLAVF